jgi:hypothetical protein
MIRYREYVEPATKNQPKSLKTPTRDPVVVSASLLEAFEAASDPSVVANEEAMKGLVPVPEPLSRTAMADLPRKARKSQKRKIKLTNAKGSASEAPLLAGLDG